MSWVYDRSQDLRVAILDAQDIKKERKKKVYKTYCLKNSWRDWIKEQSLASLARAEEDVSKA